MQFRRRINIAPGVQLNLSKGGISVSVGPRGMRYTFGRGKSDVHIGLPGTGVYYRKHIDLPGMEDKEKEKASEEEKPTEKPARKPRKARHNASQEPREQAVVQEIVPALPSDASPTEADFREGALHFLQGDYLSAFNLFSTLDDDTYLADELLMTSLTASYLEEYDTAIDSLIALLEAGHEPLPGDADSLTTRYLPDTTVQVPLTQFAQVDLPLNMTMAALLLAELLSAKGRYEEALDLIEGLFEASPGDPALLLSLADLYSQEHDFDKLHDVLVANQAHVNAEDDISLGLMYYWGVALAVREMYDATDEVFKTAQRKAKHNDELMKLLMYAHADLYERTDRAADARKLFERVYAMEPTFYDVADRVEALKEV
jgi:tetratricopeptide (TPR) repeat protein